MALCARREPEPAYRETSASSSSCSNLEKYRATLYQRQSQQNVPLLTDQTKKNKKNYIQPIRVNELQLTRKSKLVQLKLEKV